MADLYYIDDDYFTPDGYFVYTADAGAAVSSAVTVSATVGVLKQYASTIDSSSSLSAIISHIHGADLEAFSNASVSTIATVIRNLDSNISATVSQTAQFGRIRESAVSLSVSTSVTATAERIQITNVSLSSTNTLSVDATVNRSVDISLATQANLAAQSDKLVSIQSSQSSQFSLDSSLSLSKEFAANIASQFSLTAQGIKGGDTIITAFSNASVSTLANRTRDILSSISSASSLNFDINKVVQATVTLSSSVSQTTQAVKSAEVSASLAASSTLSSVISKTSGIDISAFSNASVSTSANRTRSTASSLSSQVSLTFDINKVVQGQIEISGAFTPSVSVNLFRDTLISLQTTASVTASIIRLRKTNVSLSSSFAVSDQSNDPNIGPSVNVTAQTSATLSSQSTLSVQATKRNGFVINLSGAFSPTITVKVTKNSFAVLDSVSTVSVTARKTVSASSSVSSAITLSASLVKSSDVSAALSSQVTLTAQARRPSRLIDYAQYSQGTRYTEVGTSTIGSKWGTGSLKITPSVVDTTISPRSANPVYYGSTFYLINKGYTWTSSDGITWSRTTNDLSVYVNVNIDIKVLNNLLVLFGTNGSVYTSGNGVTWTSYTITQSSYTAITIDYYNGYWYWSGSNGTSNFAIFRATTLNPGGGWTQVRTESNSGFTNLYTAVSANTGSQLIYFISVQAPGGSFTNSVIYGSATSWTRTNIDSAQANRGLQIAHGGGTTLLIYTNTDTTKTSTNLSTWTSGPSLSNFSTDFKKISYKNSRWFVFDDKTLYSGTSLSSLSTVRTFNPLDQFATVEYGNSRYVYTLDGDYTVYSTDASSWTTKQIESVENLPGYVEYTGSSLSDLNEFATIDFWFYPSSGVDGNTIIFGKRGFSTSDLGYQLQLISSTGLYFYQGGNTLIAPSGSITTNTWNHVRISRSGSTISLYTNGTRRDTDTWTATTNSVPLTFGRNAQSTNTAFYIDEFVITDEVLTDPSLTSYTMPTQAFANTVTTDILLHFDGTLEDDSQLPKIQQGIVSISATSVLTATVTESTGAISAALSTQVTVAAAAAKTVRTAVIASSQVTQTCSGTRVRFGQSALTSQSSLSATVTVTKRAVSAISSAFSQTAVNARTRDTAVTTDSIATQLSAVARIGQGIILLESSVIVSASVRKTASAQGQITSSSTLSVSITKALNATAALTTAVTQSTAATKFVGITATTSSLTTLSVTIGKLQRATAGISSTSSVLANISKTNDIGILAFTNASLTVSGRRQRIATISVTSTCSVQVLIIKAVRTTAALTAFNSQVTVGNIIHIDPYLTWRIANENRTRNISEEVRTRSIEQETRTYIIEGA